MLDIISKIGGTRVNCHNDPLRKWHYGVFTCFWTEYWMWNLTPWQSMSTGYPWQLLTFVKGHFYLDKMKHISSALFDNDVVCIPGMRGTCLPVSPLVSHYYTDTNTNTSRLHSSLLLSLLHASLIPAISSSPYHEHAIHTDAPQRWVFWGTNPIYVCLHLERTFWFRSFFLKNFGLI